MPADPVPFTLSVVERVARVVAARGVKGPADTTLLTRVCVKRGDASESENEMMAVLLATSVAMTPRSPLWTTSLGRRAAGATLELGSIFGGAYALREYVADARHIPSESMHPTFKVGDLFILDKVSIKLRSPERGDVVCFRPPPELSKLLPNEVGAGTRGVCAIKRIVAVPGDRVSVRRGRLFINGRAAEEPYLADQRIGYRMRSRRVPAGHVFVLGDNRNDSYDSHLWGCLSSELLIGRPLCTYWPPRRWCGRTAYTYARRGGARTSMRSQRLQR